MLGLVTWVASSLSRLIPFSISSSQMTSIECALCVFTLACLLPAAIALANGMDLAHPTVYFPPIYYLATATPVLGYVLRDEPFHPGTKVQYIPLVLYACGTAILGFALAAAWTSSGQWRHREYTDQEANARSYLAKQGRNVFAILFLVPAVLLAAYLLRYDIDVKSPSGHPSLELYTMYKRGLGAMSLSVICAAAFDSVSGSRSRPAIILAILVSMLLLCTWVGERDVALVGFVVVCIYARRLGKIRVLLTFAALFLFFYTIGELRVDARRMLLGNAPERGRSLSIADKQLVDIVPICSNLHVFTNTVYVIPGSRPHFYGQTFLDSVATFWPDETDAKERSPMIWFQDNYDLQGEAGFGFALDAEGYMNFGWSGPAIVFAFLGGLLGWLFHRSHALSSHPVASCMYWICLLTTVFGIRSDSRAWLKVNVYAFLLCLAVWCLVVGIARLSNYRSVGPNEA